MIYIVSGPSFSGKSQFIFEGGAEIVPIDKNKIEYLAPFIKNGKDPFDGMTLHFNIDRAARRGTKKILQSIRAAGEVEAIVLITPDSELKERIYHYGTASGRSMKPYENARKILEACEGEAFGASFYEEWIDLLKSTGIRVRLVESSLGAFSVISPEAIRRTLAKEVTNTETRYSKNEIERMLIDHNFDKYHRVELPYGLHATGQDVWDRFPLVFPPSLYGMSLLDIGCAHGAFSFEAERRGAKVVASDKNSTRLQAAKQLGEIIGSAVEFTDRNFLDDGIDASYDIVLLLNVLHHVDDPVAALRNSAKIAKKYLIIEFPTSADPLYKGKNMRQIVGPHLIEELYLFGRVDLIPSPKDGRIIGICSKVFSETWPSAQSNDIPRNGTPRHERLFTENNSEKDKKRPKRGLWARLRRLY